VAAEFDWSAYVNREIEAGKEPETLRPEFKVVIAYLKDLRLSEMYWLVSGILSASADDLARRGNTHYATIFRQSERLCDHLARHFQSKGS
jgi:hypothetical protein